MGLGGSTGRGTQPLLPLCPPATSASSSFQLPALPAAALSSTPLPSTPLPKLFFLLQVSSSCLAAETQACPSKNLLKPGPSLPLILTEKHFILNRVATGPHPSAVHTLHPPDSLSSPLCRLALASRGQLHKASSKPPHLAFPARQGLFPPSPRSSQPSLPPSRVPASGCVVATGPVSPL